MNRFLLSRTLCSLLTFALAGFNGLFAASSADRLVNISSRGGVGTDGNVMIAGFVVGGGTPKKVLIRAVGPGLIQYGVSGVLADPILELHDSTNAIIATNDNWNSADTVSMSDAGAFALTAGSKDSVIVATLNPGLYTAVVSGLNRTSGVGLVEVYDMSGTARLINISTRAQIGTGSSILISGLIVGQAAGNRRILIRAAGPALTPMNVPGALADPSISLIKDNSVIATNDNWSSGDAAAVATLTSAMAQAGAFPFTAGSKDSALIVELPAGPYTVHLSGINNTAGVALMECYDITPGASTQAATISAVATTAVTASTMSTPAVITFTRSGDVTEAVTVNYTLAGDARLGVDYSGPTGSIVIPAGQSDARMMVTALNSAVIGTKKAIVNVTAPIGYTVGTSGALVTLYYGPGSLYLGNLRATATATSSSAFGTATIQLGADERYALINVSYSGLSSPQTVAYLRLSQAGEDGAYLLKIPNGQLTSAEWDIKAIAGYTAADIVAAIKAGKVYVDIATTAYPSGELRGPFVVSSGSQVFTPPPAPPVLPAGAPTPQAAARFLTQATFGPTKAEIDALVPKGFNTWITEQMALPASLHLEATTADFVAFNTDVNATRAGGNNRQAAWLKIALTSPDQLRQRVAFALSEIFVISDVNETIGNWQEGAANYYDLLVTGAFGNYRTLLENVTVSPMMGVYLSHLRNRKATATTQPDENYAREVMQLFSIGLNSLQPDGTLELDRAGLPKPTYTQPVISEMAKVFTGWQFNNPAPSTSNFRSGGGAASDYQLPMTLNPNFHDTTAKAIVNGITLPANQGGEKDLKDTLDALFNHPNTGPFISRQLIQRLVTSNPGPGYIYRVARVFANNGNGVRGDLGAVVRAILTDHDARSPQVAATQSFGKLKEPLLRSTALYRAFGAAADNGRYTLSNSGELAQMALRSPTVFNFFEPNYVVPGSLASAGLYAPEFQILTDTTAISMPNNYFREIYATRSATRLGLTLTGLPPTSPSAALVDYLNLVLCGGSMPTTTRDRIAAALTAMPAATNDTERYRAAIYLTASTQSSAVQK